MNNMYYSPLRRTYSHAPDYYHGMSISILSSESFNLEQDTMQPALEEVTAVLAKVSAVL